MPHSLSSFLKRYRNETLFRFKNSYTYDGHTNIIYGSIRGHDGAQPCMFVSTIGLDYFAIASITPVDWPFFKHHKIFTESTVDFDGTAVHQGHLMPDRAKLIERPLIDITKYPDYTTYDPRKHRSWKKAMNTSPPIDTAWTMVYDLDVNTGMVTPIVYTKKEIVL